MNPFLNARPNSPPLLPPFMLESKVFDAALPLAPTSLLTVLRKPFIDGNTLMCAEPSSLPNAMRHLHYSVIQSS